MSKATKSKKRAAGSPTKRGKKRLKNALRHPLKALKRALASVVYWRKRKALTYYQEVIRIAREVAPSGGSVIDIGAHRTQVLQDLPWFARRVALDRGEIPPQDGVETVRANFHKWSPDQRFDLVLCLQVLEHLKEPAEFAQRLFETGKTVIISVPYRWPKGTCKQHIQDPVDEEKLLAWTGREPTFTHVVTDRRARIIAVYR